MSNFWFILCQDKCDSIHDYLFIEIKIKGTKMNRVQKKSRTVKPNKMSKLILLTPNT